MMLFTDPVSGRQYVVDPVSGESRWVESAPAYRTQPVLLREMRVQQDPAWPGTARAASDAAGRDAAGREAAGREAAGREAAGSVPPAGSSAGRRTPLLWGAGAFGGLLLIGVVASLGSASSKVQPLAGTAGGPATSSASGGPSSAVGTGPAAGQATITHGTSARAGVAVTARPSLTSARPSTPSTPSTKAAGSSVKAAGSSVKAAGSSVKAAHSVATGPSGCDPNYAGACVPIASDVDCAGGKGNGPAYVRGPVQVIGKDIYGLDANHDGVGCE